LSHLAVALGRPTVGIYCATDPLATGLYGSARAVNVGGLGHRPQVEEVLAAFGSVRIANPAGMSSMT
jgi:heptosyltransferase-1